MQWIDTRGSYEISSGSVCMNLYINFIHSKFFRIWPNTENKKFTAHYACRNADLNLIVVAATTTWFIFSNNRFANGINCITVTPIYLTETNLGIVVPIQESKFPNQLTAEVKLNCKKNVQIDAVFDTAWRCLHFSSCIFLTLLYNYHKLDLYGQKKSIYILNTHTNRDQPLNFLRHKETPSIPDV